MARDSETEGFFLGHCFCSLFVAVIKYRWRGVGATIRTRETALILDYRQQDVKPDEPSLMSVSQSRKTNA